MKSTSDSWFEKQIMNTMDLMSELSKMKFFPECFVKFFSSEVVGLSGLSFAGHGRVDKFGHFPD